MPLLDNLTSLASSGLGILQSGIESRQQRDNINLQNKRNMELSKYQFDQNKQMFDYSNEYNSPAQQMKRYESAGLNKNLIYGQGTAGNAPNTLPQYQAPTYRADYKPPADVSGAINNFMNIKIQEAQLKNLQADRRIKEQDALKKESGEPFYKDQSVINYLLSRYKLAPAELQNFISNQDLGQFATKVPYGTSHGGRVTLSNYNVSDDQALNNVQHFFRRYTMPYAIQEKQLEKYNADIAIANARKDLIELDVQNYLPPWVRLAAGNLSSLFSLGKGLFKSKSAQLRGSTTTKTYKKSPSGGSSTQTQSFNY